MRTTTPKQLAILISLATSIVLAASSIILNSLKGENLLVWILFLALAVFFLVYLIVFYSINRFIIKKIKPIFKVIRDTNIPDEELLNSVEDRDLIDDVQNDVTLWARKKAREISQLRQLERYRREFLGDVSHELKTPVFNIQGYVSTLLDGGLEDESINRHYLERTEKSVNRLISIITDLESISRLESGELQMEYSRFDITKLVEEVFDELEMKAKKVNIMLKLDRGGEKAIWVRADRHRILEVMNNLVGNSIKYGKEGGQTTVSFLDMDDHLMVDITDNGIGISGKDLPRIFERFYRTDKSRSREMGGTGLGLAIVKHIIEAHKQTVNVQSKPDKGTSFSFTLQKA
ncbi:MAG: sensor histidine kinase [Bacteroidales bacterium]|nr:sensor histidine kinase [Bacteroidales bacterium]